jgi:hypothetical protein
MYVCMHACIYIKIYILVRRKNTVMKMLRSKNNTQHLILLNKRDKEISGKK